MDSSWYSSGQNTGVGSLSLLQGIFPTQRSNPGLPYCRQILYQLSHKGSPRILELVAYPFSSGSSWPRNWTKVSHIAGRFFTNWAVREAQVYPKMYHKCWSQHSLVRVNITRWPLRKRLNLRISEVYDPAIWSPSQSRFTGCLQNHSLPSCCNHKTFCKA